MSEKEIEILNSNLSITNDYVSKQDSIISTMKEKESSYVKTIESHGEITDLNKKTIENLNLTIAKERKKTKRWKAICGGVFLGFLLIAR